MVGRLAQRYGSRTSSRKDAWTLPWRIPESKGSTTFSAEACHATGSISCKEIRQLSQSSLRYRRQLLALKQYFVGKQSTVLLLDDRTSGEGDPQLQSLANGVLLMEQVAQTYGEDRRRLRVVKMRAHKFRAGF